MFKDVINIYNWRVGAKGLTRFFLCFFKAFPRDLSYLGPTIPRPYKAIIGLIEKIYFIYWYIYQLKLQMQLYEKKTFILYYDIIVKPSLVKLCSGDVYFLDV